MKALYRRCLGTLAIILVAVGGVFAVEVLLAIAPGRPDPPFKNPGHQPSYFGASGPQINYLVIGDSTAAGRGAPYTDGIAVRTAEHLASNRRVTMVNLSISGAIAATVLHTELPEIGTFRPDLVLLSVGANDATHFTRSAVLGQQLDQIIAELRVHNPKVNVVVTGCPQMGSIPRFAQPLRWFAGTQTDRINRVFADAAAGNGLVWARLADRTGPIFARDPSLFAPDQFHPNERGYAVWIPVLNEALDQALRFSEIPCK